METECGEVAQAVVRVFSRFPITSWDTDTREELHFDPEPFHNRFRSGRTSAEDAEDAPPHSAWYLLGCPNCNDNRREKPRGFNAGNLIELSREAHRLDPTRPNHTHVCNAYKDQAYFLYGEVCDIMVINPYEVVFRGADPAVHGRDAALAKLASRPRPLMSLPGAFEVAGNDWYFPAPGQLRLDVYYQIAEGVKGISYYEKQFYSESPELEAEIGRINRELQAMKPYLKISEPFRGLAKASDPAVQAHALVCGDHGLALILINTDYETGREGGERYINATPRENFHVEIEMPPWLGAGQVFEVGQRIRRVDFQMEGNRVIIPVSRLDLTGMYLIHPAEN